MAYFDWKDEYSVHIPQIDSQHRKLVSLLNELFEAMQSGKGRDSLERILTNLVDYTVVHFAAEERLMRSHAFPGYLQHYAEHTRFTERVKDLQNQYQSGRAALSIQVSGFLKEWLKDHILQADQQYSSHIQSHVTS